MPFVVRCPDGDTAVEVDLVRPSATVADLIDAISALLDPARSAVVPRLELHVDGRALDPNRSMVRAGIPDGAVVTLAPVSRCHAASRGDRPSAPPLAHGTVPFNRPPRPALPLPPDPLHVPEPPAGSTGGPPFSVAAIGAPLVMAAVLAVVFHNLVWGLFSLLGPVMFLGTWLEQRRRGHTRSRRDDARWRAALVDLAHEIHRAAALERERRRAILVDPAEVAQRAAARTSRVWERRPHHDDWLVLRTGVGDVPWTPHVRDETPRPAEVEAMLAAATSLPETPAALDLRGDRIVGIVGDRARALDLARALVVQAAVHHGPADLAMLVATDPEAASAWDWARWLPHLIDHGTGRRCIAATPEAADALALERLGERSATRTTLVVVDDRDLTTHRRSALRSTLRAARDDVSGIVVASHAELLPWSCTVVVDVHADGCAQLERAGLASDATALHIDGVPESAAAQLARDLARLSDPELDGAHSALPATVSLAGLLGDAATDPAAIRQQWDTAGPDPRPVATIGLCDDGVCTLDLAIDGPHTLIAGTTGSGKSELLRTLIAALAAASPPEQLAFVLVDFKGGAAFDAVADLPHVVGLVTDLDPRVATRAVRGLEAELRRRERLLRSVGAEDLTRYRASEPDEAIARLVVVIDEFATLAADQPDVLDALVGVAQRGRSMGVHLVLATQRPAGSVSDHIRANTNLRIALRVQDAHDSLDVLDVPDAAHISRHRPGRALVRLGPAELTVMQAATGTARAAPTTAAKVRLVPFGLTGSGRLARALAASNGPAPARAAASGSAPSELEQLVASIRAAHDGRAVPPPPRPWPDPLPRDLPLAEVPHRHHATSAERTEVLFALADDPDHQCRRPVGWRLDAGNLLLVGGPRSGTTTALASIACRVAGAPDPRPNHIYALDLGRGDLGALAELECVGAVIGASEAERQRRLLQRLDDEVAERRATPNQARDRPRLVVLIDGIGAFVASWDDPMQPVLAQLGQVLRDGPALGIHVAMTAKRIGAVPMAWLSAISQRAVFELADAADYAFAGVATNQVPDAVPGRAVWCPDGVAAQVGRPTDPPRASVDSRAGTRPPVANAVAPPEAIATLPQLVPARDLAGSLDLDPRRWHLPIGIADRSLEPAPITLYPGEHALIAGPARSGRSTALAGLATLVGLAPSTSRPVVIGVCGPRSALREATGIDVWIDPDACEGLAALTRLDTHPAGALVLVDDAERVADPDGVLASLAGHAPRQVHLVAAGRAAALRSAYGHWTRTLSAAGVGVLLRPDTDLDGDLLGVTVPRRCPAPMAPGRGWLVDRGGAEFVQLLCTD